MIQGGYVSLENMPFFQELNYFIDGFLRGQSVPIYFFISGYVFFLGVTLTREKYAQKLKSRVKTLLIPYLIWNVVFALIRALFRLLPGFSSVSQNSGSNALQLNLTLSGLLETFWDNSKGLLVPVTPQLSAESVPTAIYPADYPLWFVRDLMIVVLCAPLLYWILKRARHWFVLLLGILWFALPYWVASGHWYQLLMAFFFFSWGAYMSVNEKDMMHEFNRFFKPSMVGYPLLALLYVASVHYCPDLSATIKKVNILVGLFFAYNAAFWLLSHKVCKMSPFLASSSFFIYVTHAFVCSVIVKVFFLAFHPTGDLGMFLIHASAVIIAVGMLLSVFYLMRRYTPGLLKVLTGRK